MDTKNRVKKGEENLVVNGSCKFTENGQFLFCFGFCPLDVRLPRLSFVIRDTKISWFVIHLEPGFSTLMVPAFCLLDRVNKVVEDFSLLMLTHQWSAHDASSSAACCIL